MGCCHSKPAVVEAQGVQVSELHIDKEDQVVVEPKAAEAVSNVALNGSGRHTPAMDVSSGPSATASDAINRSSVSISKQGSVSRLSVLSILRRISNHLTAPSSRQISATERQLPPEKAVQPDGSPAACGDPEDEEGEEEEKEEDSVSDDDDIVEEGVNVGSHGGRVLAPIKRTTKLQVGVLEGTTFLNQYVVVDTLGRGTFGNVKLCLNTTDDRLYAVKAVNKKLLRRQAQGGRSFGHDPIEDLKREVEVMRALNHPNLIKLKEVIEDKEGGKVLMVMEYASGGALVGQNQLTPEHHMPEPMAQYYFTQIVSGLAYLHCNKVVHGDMKPENVLLAGDCTLKIADFGQSQFFEKRDTFNKTRGTPAFLPPEVCAGGAYHGRRADMWALGVSLYLFVYGVLPFKAETIPDLYDVIADGTVVYPHYVQPSHHLMDLMQSLLERDPNKRATSAEILQHPWITGTQWMSLLPDMEHTAEDPDDSELSTSPRAPVEDYTAMVFPEIQGTTGLKSAAPNAKEGSSAYLHGRFPIMEALLAAANKGRRALRVRDASHLRTLAWHRVRSSLRQLSSGDGSLPIDLRPAYSCTSTIGGSSQGDFNSGVMHHASFDGSSSKPQRRLPSTYGTGAQRGPQGAQLQSEERGSTLNSRPSVASTASSVHWAPSLRQFSLEGPFAGGGPGLGDANREGASSNSSSAHDSKPAQGEAEGVPPSGVGQGVTEEGGVEGPGLGDEDNGENIQCIQSAPAGAFASAFQRMLHTAVRLQGSSGSRSSGEAPLSRAGGSGNLVPQQQEAEVKAQEEELATESLGSAERLTAEAFERMVELMQQGEQAEHGGEESQQEQQAEQDGPQQRLTFAAPLSRRQQVAAVHHHMDVHDLRSLSADQFPGLSGLPGTGVVVAKLSPPPSPPSVSLPIISELSREGEDLAFSMSMDEGDILVSGGDVSLSPPPSHFVQDVAEPAAGNTALTAGSPPPLGGELAPANPAAGDSTSAKAAVDGSAPLAISSASAGLTTDTSQPSFGGLPASPFTGHFSLDKYSSMFSPLRRPSQSVTALSGQLEVAATGGSASTAVGPVDVSEVSQVSTRGTGRTANGDESAGEAGQRAERVPSSLPQRSEEGYTDPMTGNYLGKKPFHQRPPLPKGSGSKGMGDKLNRLWPMSSHNSMLYEAIPLQHDNLPPMQLMTFHPGELMASYMGGSSPVLAYIESGTVDVNYQANLPVPLSTMAALATGLMPGGPNGQQGGGQLQKGAGSLGIANGLTLLNPDQVHSLLIEMDDKLDSLAYGSHLVDVASAWAERSTSITEGRDSGRSEPQLERAQTLMLTVKRATDRAEQLLRNATVGGSIDELLVSERGPNEFIGALVALDPDYIDGRWKMHVVARTQVVAVVMTKEGLGTFLQQNPLAQVHLRAALAQTRSEITRLEALEKLAAAREHREQRRREAMAVAAMRRRPLERDSGVGVRVGSVVQSAASIAGTRLEAFGDAAGDVLAGVAEGVASLDVFGLVSRLRAALEASQVPASSE